MKKKNKLAFLLLTIFSISFYSVSPAFAFYDDKEEAKDVGITATTLDMTLTSDTSSFIPDEPLASGNSQVRNVTVGNVGKLDFDYSLQYEYLSGDADFCNALNLDVSNGSSVYSGPLAAFNYLSPSTLLSGNSDNYVFTISLPSDANQTLSGKTCNFTIRAYSWQPELGNWGIGFWDTETLDTSSSGGGTPVPQNPEVVINEVMWMGSSVSTADEWIELRNMTNHDIDLRGWDIDGAVAGAGGHLEIPSNGNCRFSTCVIPANGFFLIANKYEDQNSALSDANILVDLRSTNISLNNDYIGNGQLILRDSDGNLIDQTPIPTTHSWPKGTNGDINQSMERNLTPGDGLDSNNWHTCEDAVCNDGTYWDTADGPNYGTPGGENHSENDISQQSVEPQPGPSPTPLATPEPSPLGTPEPTAEAATPSPTPSETPLATPVPSESPSPTSTSSTEPTPAPSSEPATEPSQSPELLATPEPTVEPTPDVQT